MKIKMEPYQAKWAQDFEQEAQSIRSVLEDNAIAIFHIGSTAVPDLAAKPIIDCMPVVHSLKQVDEQTSAFERLGYEVMGEFGMVGRRYMRKGGDDRTHQIHIFRSDNAYDIFRHIAFRDYLRNHAAVREAYARLKGKLAKEFPNDIESYGDGKAAFVEQTEKDAMIWAWRGLAKQSIQK